MTDPADATTLRALSERALAVSDEHGGAVLVVGGTLAQRRAWVADALRHVSALAPAPLVVQLDARAIERVRAAGPSLLADEIAAAAEDALRAVHAPGGLYDDPAGGPLAPLGGWLFRARTAGQRGVLLVLEDVDTWLDARGASASADALALVTRALDECARRPVSLLATARAADASGAPALANELVSRFAHVVRLGGAATVTRDPGALVAALAGRSFTLGALKNALAGWLEVPAGDDTVVVFTSPLAPPLVPAPEASPAVEWPQPSRPPEPARVSPNAPASSAPLGHGWTDAVRAAVEVRDALGTLANLGAPKSHRQFERAYRDAISRLPLALVALERGERALGLDATRLRERGVATLARFDHAFGEYYRDAFDTWMSGTPRPTMLCDLPGQLSRVATERGARGTALVLVTGLRLDAFRRLRERVLPRVAGLEWLDEGLTWAARPCTPATQRELLARGLASLAAELPKRDEPTAPRTLDEALRPRREHLGHTEVLRIDAYATELVRAEKPLDEALAPIEAALPAALQNLLGGLSPRTVVALASDVGVREVTRRADDKERGRFAYGGDSPFEAIVPYAVLAYG